MSTIYLLDAQLCFAGAVEIDLMAALPGPCTLVAPPATTGAEVAQWQGAWVVLPEYPVPPVPALLPRQEAAWERIKAERDRRKYLGVKVTGHWYHSDDSSRIQQLGLVMMGASIPPGLQWKTLTLSPPPVFVTMTQALAGGIFQATAASDQAIFGAAEVHRVAMEASETPESYDAATGWPASIEDEQP